MLGKLFVYYRFLGIVMLIGGIGYLYLLSENDFNNATYMSEKALSPGVIEEQFGPSSYISDFYKQVKEQYTVKNMENGKFQSWLAEQLFDIGLDSHTQNFTFAFPMILGDRRLHGSNVAGILRAYRAARTEALVLLSPLRPIGGPESHTAGSVALLLSLAKYFRRQTYWAKDVIFLFTEMEMVGLQAWLYSYHGESQLLQPAIFAAELAHRSGSIQAAVCLDFDDMTFGEASLHVEGVNGILPNLDLVNTMARVGRKQRFSFLLHSGRRAPGAELLRMLLHQASGSPASLHGLFLPFEIPAVGVSARRKDAGRRRHSLAEAARVTEGAWRSLNNLQERLHQSFFFYALPRLDRYVSIGDYMPSMGLALAGLLLAACRTLGCRVFPDAASGRAPELPPLWPLLRLCALAWGFGLFAFLAPNYFVRLSASFRIDPGAGLLIGLLAVQLVSAAYPTFFRASGLLLCDADFLRLVASLAAGVCLGALSLVNFGLAFLSACGLAPACLLASAKLPTPLWLLVALLHLVVSPLGLLLVGCSLANDAGSLGACWTCAEYAALQAVVEESLLFSWTYRLFTLVLMPCWLLSWSQLFVVDQPAGEEQQQVGGEQPISGKQAAAAAGEQPISGKQAAAGEQPISGKQAAAGGQPISGKQAAAGEQPISGKQAAAGGQPISGKQAAAGGQPISGKQAASEQPISGKQAAAGGQPISGKQAAGEQPISGKQAAAGGQ